MTDNDVIAVFVEAVYTSHYNKLRQILSSSKELVIASSIHKRALELSCRTGDDRLFEFLVTEFYPDYMTDYAFIKGILNFIVRHDLGSLMAILLNKRLYEKAQIRRAFIYTVIYGRPRIVEALLGYPHFKLTEVNSRIAIEIARENGFLEIEYLLAFGARHPEETDKTDSIIF